MQNVTLRFDSGGVALYRQLYQYFVDEMKAGAIAPGEKLPSKRALAAHLGVSVNTVDTAYQMLAAEGYVDARAKSGFFAAQLMRLPQVSRRVPLAAQPTEQQWKFDFGTRAIDTELFPRKSWARLVRDVLAQDADVLNPGNRQGDENLRAAIAAYLHDYRGVVCTLHQVVVGAGIEYLLSLLAALLPGHSWAVEDPGYPRTAAILANSGARVVRVSVDGEGMSVERLAQSGAQVAYVTPSHQFPTGVVMSAARRSRLLAWAAEHGGYLIEDDYDSEFRFSSRPIPAMQGMDNTGCVVYVGTFSKSIAPGIRMAYMVLPPALLQQYYRVYGSYSCTVSRIDQQAVCRFITGGAFAHHLRRLRKAYRLRRDALVQALRACFGAQVQLSGLHTGLHVLVHFPEADGAKLQQLAANAGVRCTALSQYFAYAPADSGATMVLGYAGLTVQQIKDGVHLLADTWQNVIKPL